MPVLYLSTTFQLGRRFVSTNFKHLKYFLEDKFIFWRSGKEERKHRPGAIGEDQHTAAVEQAVLELASVARPVAEGQLTQTMT